MSDEVLEIDGYKLTNCIATGNASEIWELGDQSAGGQPLCMKLLLPQAMDKPEAKQVLKHEAKVCHSLDHPNIVKVHKISVTKKHAYMVMDYFRAPNIKNQILGDLHGLHSRFAKVFESLCLALGYVHQKGWVHRDIKPDNILANKVGELRLIDFSLAVRSAGGLGKLLGSRMKAVQGTRTYIAPETLLKKSPTFQTDMYSIGITVFEMLTGHPPFRSISPGELLRMHVQEKAPIVSSYNPNITPEMDKLVARLLEKKPEKRHKTMEEVFAEFRALKPFKEDPKELHAVRQEKQRQADLDGLGASERINSRRDHARSEAGLNAPPQKIQVSKPAAKPKPQNAPPRPAEPQHQPQPQSPGQPAAGQGYGPPAGMPYPNYPPGYGFPPGMQPPPGYPMPPQYAPQFPPGGPMPPGYPPQQGPGQQPPVQPPPQQSSPPQQPSSPQPSSPQQQQSPPAQPKPQAAPAAGSPPAQPKPKPEPQPSKDQEEGDIPLMEMDELPDVI